jgi:hypothetical protein
MSIIQKNVFGDNIIYSVSPDFTRQLTDELQREILSTLSELNVSAVAIRFELGSETGEYVLKISQFLDKHGFKVYSNRVMMSEITRNEFSIQKHPSDSQVAIMKIGPLI